jgi:hypothetical protein
MKRIEEDNIRLNISFFFIGFFIATILLFEKYIGLDFEKNIPSLIVNVIYFLGYGFGSLLLLIYITFRSLHYRYRNKDRFGSRDDFKVSKFNQEVFYDIGVDSIISSVTLAITFAIIKFLGKLFHLNIF